MVNLYDNVEHEKHLDKYKINANIAMATIVLSIFVDMLGYSMLIPLLPSIAKEYGAGDFLIGIITASNAFAALIFAPIWGKLSDNVGRKPILIVSQAGTLASFLLLGVSNSITGILASRLLDGIFGGQMPIVRAYVSDITTPQTRPLKVAKIQVASAISFILGPSIGGFLGIINWRIPAFLAVGLSGIAIILTATKIIESMPKQRREDLKKILENKRKSENKKKTILNRRFILRINQFFIVNLITLMFTTSMALVIDERYHRPVSDIGLLMTTIGILMILNASLIMKRFLKFVGEKRALIISIFAFIPTLLTFAFLNQFWMMYLFVIPFAFCRTTVGPLIQANITKSVDPDQQGIASGWSTNMQSIAQTVAPLISTAFLEIGSVQIPSLFNATFDAYWLIGGTATFFALILFIIIIIDLKLDPNLYNYNTSELQPSNPSQIKSDNEIA
ncbi:MAG: MFS transporter [Promethearchaeota archaeon]